MPAAVRAPKQWLTRIYGLRIGDGTPAEVRAINKVGLERNGFGPESLDRVKQIHRILHRDGGND